MTAIVAALRTLENVHFHPESIMTKVGHDLLRNFLGMREEATPHSS